MPTKWCVPFCKGNYQSGPKVSIYRFPTDEEILRTWIRRIQRKDFHPNKNSRFSEPHTRGSSHGQTRLIRSSYPEKFYAEMIPHAFQMWREVEADTGETLMENVGCVCLAKSQDDAPLFRKCVASMKESCPQFLEENDPRVAKWFSTHFKYESPPVLMDKAGGVLMADRSAIAIRRLFRERGGTMWSNCAVQKIEPLGDEEVKLHTTRPEVVTVKSVVVCAGTWTSRVLAPFIPDLPAKPMAVRVHYWKEKVEGAYSLNSGFPTFIDISEPHVYGLPSNEYPGLMKVCIHGGTDCDPDARDKSKHCPKLESAIRKYVKEHLPLLEDEPAIVETCMYTVTPDENFLVDYVPQHRNIVYGAGFSGTGFKTSPVIGRILSEMATGSKPFLDIEPFRLDRFKK